MVVTPFPADWAGSRELLKGYAQVLGRLGEQYQPADECEGQRGLTVAVAGPSTGPLQVGENVLECALDFTMHHLVITSSRGPVLRLPLLGQSPRALCRDLGARLSVLGMGAVQPDCQACPREDGRYRGGDVLAWWQVVLRVASVLRRLRAGGCLQAGPLMLWPENLSLGFSWYPPGATQELALGFVPGDASRPEPFFHLSPRPCPPTPPAALPEQACWEEGCLLLPYARLLGRRDAGERLAEFFREGLRLLLPGGGPG